MTDFDNRISQGGDFTYTMTEDSEQQIKTGGLGTMGTSHSSTIEEGTQVNYTDEVDLVIDAPVDLKMAAKLFTNLQTVPELRIVRTMGSLTRGTVITVVLNKPMQLIKILSSRLPDVKMIPEKPVVRHLEGKEYSSQDIARIAATKRIMLATEGVQNIRQVTS